MIPLLLLGTSRCSSSESVEPGKKPDVPGIYVPGNTEDIDGDQQIKVNSGQADQFQPNESIERSWDGDMNTLYHSPWVGTKFPVTLEYRFKGPEDVDYIVYKPRLDAENGLFGEFELFVATEAEPEFTKVGDFDFQLSGSPSSIVFDERIEGATKFKFSVKTGGNDFVSCAEMEFCRYGTGNDMTAYADLFADEVLSELKPGVTRAKIEQMDNAFFRTVALSLLEETYDKEFRVQDYEPYPTVKETAQALKTSGYNPFENPTGIYFSSGSDVVVVMGDTGGENLSLRIHNFSNNSDETFVLHKGINKLHVKNSGLGYVSYYTSGWKSAKPVKIHIASGKVNGYFDIAKHTAADWSRLINGAVSTYFDLKGERVNLAFTTQDLRDYCSDGHELVRVYDEVVTMQHEIMGLAKYGLRPKNHMFGRTVESGYFADGVGIGIAKDAMRQAVDVKTIREYIWGPAHEFGHVNQIRPGLKWLGTTEVTNNVYSALVSYHYTKKISLETENCRIDPNTTELGGRMNCYLTYGVARGEPWMFQFGQDKMTGYAETGGDHIVKLCPLWQLMLYYRLSDGASWQKRDWYADVAQIVRETDDAAFSNGQHQLNFMRNTMDVIGEDLTDFFIKAGMLTPIDKTFDDYGVGTITITEEDVDELVEYAKRYPKPASSVIYYLSSQSLPAYVNRLAVQGTFGAGITDNGNDTFTVSHNIWKNVAVFETYRGEILDRVAMVGTDSPDRSTTLVRYPAGSTRIEAVAWDGTRTLVYGSR